MILQRLMSIALAVAAVQAWAQPSNMQPGLWEIQTEMEMTGMPMQLPPTVVHHCYSAEDLAQSSNVVPQSGDSNCRIMNYKQQGNTASWTIECTGQAAMRGTATMTTEPTRYHGSMKTTMQGQGAGMEMVTRWQAKRIGDCTP